jgi:hypothetical protein
MIVLLGCSEHKEQKTLKNEIFGVYKNVQPNMIEKIRHSASTYVAGSTLAISKDSTYIFKTCGIFMSGTWEQTKDSLYLSLKHYKFLNDSLNKINHNPPPKDFFVFRIKDSTLLSHRRQIDDPTKTTLNKLVRE